MNFLNVQLIAQSATVSQFVKMSSSRDVITALRGKIVKKPEAKMWYTTSVSSSVFDKKTVWDKIIKEEKEVYTYTCESTTEWTPFNTNLQMQSIKVG